MAAAVAALVAGVSIAAPAVGLAADRETVLLGDFGGDFGSAWDINDDGVVVGFARTDSGNDHAFRWEDGALVDLGTPDGGSYSVAFGIGEFGDIVGFSNDASGRYLPALWSGGSVSQPPTLGGSYGFIDDISDSGSMVGYTGNAEDDQHPTLWVGGAAQQLPTLNDNEGGEAVAINDAGIIVGASNNTAVRWIGSAVDSLDVPAPLSYAVDINAGGTIAGFASVTDERRPFRWSEGLTTFLPVPAGSGRSEATGINDAGEIVGFITDPSGVAHAAGWLPDGTYYEICPSCESGSVARAINNSGDVAGELQDPLLHAVLWRHPDVQPTTADLAASIALQPSSPEVGASASLTGSLSNNGPDDVTDADLTFTLASGTVVESAPAGCTIEAAFTICSIANLANGSNASRTLTVAYTQPGTKPSSVVASHSGDDPDPTNNGASGSASVFGAACTIVGTPSSDVLPGTAGDDVICGLSGDDTITAGAGNDWAYGGSDNDTIEAGVGFDVIAGQHGNDVIDGQGDRDAVQYFGATAAVTVHLGTATPQNTGGGGIDQITGTEDVWGSTFGDNLTGSGGANRIDGLFGNDVINGGAGGDHLVGNLGDDTLIGGPDFDYADYTDASGAVQVNLGAADNQAQGAAGIDDISGVEGIFGSAFNDQLTGNNSANDFVPGRGNDIVAGAGGFDFILFHLAPSRVVVSLAITGPQNTQGEGTDTIRQVEGVVGSAFNDSLTGNDAGNTLDGRAGADSLFGMKGADLLVGDTGNDTLNGGAGNDILNAGAGTDTCINGGGNDQRISCES